MDMKKFEYVVPDIHTATSEGLSHKAFYVVPPQKFNFLNIKITSSTNPLELPRVSCSLPVPLEKIILERKCVT